MSVRIGFDNDKYLKTQSEHIKESDVEINLDAGGAVICGCGGHVDHILDAVEL